MAQSDNTGVGMAPQAVTVDSSIRQPSVSYQATVRLPDTPLESRVEEPKTDWVNYALSEANRAIDAYGKISASRAQAATKVDKDALKKAEEAEDIAWRNQLARESAQISERVRQGSLSIEAAETAYRALGDKYITAGRDEEKVSKVIGRYDAGVRSLVQSQYSQSLTAELNRQTQQVETFRNQNPAYSNLSNAKINSIIQQVDNDMDNLARIQQRMGLYEEGSEEWYTYKALTDEIINNNSTMMVAKHVGDLLMSPQGSALTPMSIQEITNDSLNWAVRNRINPTDAQIVINRVYERMGVNTLKQNWIDTLKISTDSAKAATESIMANAKLRAMSIQQVAFYKELGGEAFEQAITSELGRSGEFNLDMGKITNEIINAARSEGTMLPPEASSAMIQGTNNAYANGSSTPYSRASTALTTLRLVNQNNTVTKEDSEGNVTIAFNNLSGASERLNLAAIRRDAKKLKASDNPELQELGDKTEKELDRLEGNKIAAEYLTPNSPMYQTVNSLFHSLNAGELRYDENGKIFLSDTSGLLGSVSFAFRGVGGKGSYSAQLKKINQSLEDLPTETRKDVMKAWGIQRAVRGETSALGGRDGVPQTIDVGEKGTELYTFDDGTVARNETGIEKLPENLPRPLHKVISDWWKKQKEFDKVPTESSSISSSMSQTFDNSYPSVEIEPSSQEGKKLLKEMEQIDLAIKGPEGSHDSLNDIINRYNRNGWNAEVFEEERDRLLQRRSEIEKKLYYDPEDDIVKEITPEEYATRAQEHLSKAAKKFDVDPALLDALFTQESARGTNIKSKTGVRGAMQITRKTFNEIAPKIGLTPEDFDKPEAQMEAGAYYLKEKLNEFGGDSAQAVAAYNAGATPIRRAVRKYKDMWLNHIEEFVDKEKAKEIRTHVKKILGYYEKYLGNEYA